MEQIKVETVEFLESKVNNFKLPSDIKCDTIKEQEGQVKLEEDIDCYNIEEGTNEPLLTESNCQSSQKSGNFINADKYCLNEDFLESKQNYSSVEQFSREVKQEIDDEDESSNTLFKEEIDCDDIPDNENIIDQYIHKEGKIWTNDTGNCKQVEVEFIQKELQRLAAKRDKNKKRSNVPKGSPCAKNSKGKSKRRTRVCLFCDYTTEDVIQLRDHSSKVHQQYVCGLCKFVTPVEFCLNRHMTVEHPKVNQADLKPKCYKCNRCDFIGTSLLRVKLHAEKVHLNLRRHKCTLCDYSAFTKGALSLHVKHVHLKLKKYMCEDCDFRTICKSIFEEHKNGVHLKLKTYECHYCDFKTAIKICLRNHINAVHLNLRNFKCTLCEYRSSRSSQLKRHVELVHIKVKEPRPKLIVNFKCELCEYSTTMRYRLKQHVDSLHLKLRPFQCNSCQYKATTKSSLNWHVNTIHLRLKKFRCTYCDYCSSKSTALTNHINFVHLRKDKFE